MLASMSLNNSSSCGYRGAQAYHLRIFTIKARTYTNMNNCQSTPMKLYEKLSIRVEHVSTLWRNPKTLCMVVTCCQPASNLVGLCWNTCITKT
jgi:hypothetical protein